MSNRTLDKIYELSDSKIMFTQIYEDGKFILQHFDLIYLIFGNHFIKITLKSFL